MKLCNTETVTSTLLQITIMYDVTFFIIQYNIAKSFSSRLRVVSRALDKTVNRSAHHEDVVDTPNPP